MDGQSSSLANLVLLAAAAVVGVGGWLAVAIWVGKEVPCADLSARAMSRGCAVSRILAVLFGVMAASVVVWGIALNLQPHAHEFSWTLPSRSPHSFSTINSSLGAWWPPIALVFATTATVTGLAAGSGRRAWHKACLLAP